MADQKQKRSHVRMASRHVAQAERCLIAQHARVRKLAALCDDQTMPVLESATALLRTFEGTVKSMRGHLEIEKGLLKRSRSP